MNNLLFTALIIALLYYFFYYLPSQKKLAHPPLKHNQSTQTEALASRITNYEPGAISGPAAIPDPEQIKKLQKDLQQKESTIIGLNNSYHQLETKSKTEIDNLKEQLKELSEIEKKVDNLIKDIQDLNQEL
jgi:flagellar motility protein MotE (MotC chaperone)